MLILGLSETTLRLLVFALTLALLAAAERRWPRRALRQGRRRWPANLGLVMVGTLALRLMAWAGPVLMAVGAAQWAARQGWGVLNQFAGWPVGKFAVSLIALDALVWAQHLAFHRVGWFWRFHQVHHADRDLDVTTALRFHPLEIAASMGIKVLGVLLLGPSAAAVVVFEIVLNACALFNHANLRLPLGVDRGLRGLIVTPDMHRVHHSVHHQEQHRNFGFCLSVWDRVFGSYAAQPRDGHTAMQIGLHAHQDDAPAHLGWSLALPFKPPR